MQVRKEGGRSYGNDEMIVPIMFGGSVGGGFVGGGSVGGGLVGGTSVGGGLVGMGFGLEVGVSRSLGRFVIVGGISVGEGDEVGVMDGATVGEEVRVKTGMTEAVAVKVAVGGYVAVTGKVAETARVGVVEPPVSGITKSGSGDSLEWEPRRRTGRPKAMTQINSITK